MSEDIYFGPGTTPKRVVEAVEAAKEAAETQRRPKASTAETERFFARIAEDLKRAGAG